MTKGFFGHPAGLFTLFFTEMWERFSYYGMRAILMLFMVAKLAEENSGLGVSAENAGAIYGLYTASVYLLTLPGGWLADNIFGQRKAIWYGGIIIMLGHISLAIPGLATFYGGLVLVAIGTGLLKANISTIVGDLYPEGGARRDAGFSIFYMGINIGSFAGQLIVGYLGEQVNWHYGFGAAAVGMFLGLWMYKVTEYKYLGNIGVTPKAREAKGEGNGSKGSVLAIVMAIILIAFITTLHMTGVVDMSNVRGMAEAMGYIIVSVAALYFAYVLIAGGLSSIEKRKVIVIIFLFIGAALFWSGFEQAGSTLNLFAERHTLRFFGPLGIAGLFPFLLGGVIFVLLSWIWYKYIFTREDLLTSLKVITSVVFAGLSVIGWWLLSNINEGWEMPASWLQSINPMFIIILAPVFGMIWVKLAAVNMNPTAPLKFAFGLICLGLGFLVMVFASRVVVGGLPELVRVPATWLVMTYLLHTTGELTLSPVGLSMTTKLAPKKFAGQMMGIWFIGAALGNLIAGLFAGNFDEGNVAEMPDLFMSVVIMGVGAGFIFVLFSPFIKKWIGDVK
ncbi:MAG: peptide MFS transporter [Cyclobacteriaceae bacterium]|nr:peptide MFS transporter [Cyclobacteriaceae bacterium]